MKMKDLNLSEQEIKEARLIEKIKTLNLINFQIADLNQVKARLEQEIADASSHPDDKSRTYEHGAYKVTISTGWNYRLDKKLYSELADCIPQELNPVSIKTAYELDKKKIKALEEDKNIEGLAILDQLITKTPKKLNVKIGANS
jgi:hypothetical protein